MDLIIKNDKGWADVYFYVNCNYDKFYLVAEILENNFGIIYKFKVNDFDSLYWEFEYKGSLLMLHYDIYFGVSLYPAACKEATSSDNEKVIELAKSVFEKMKTVL